MQELVSVNGYWRQASIQLSLKKGGRGCMWSSASAWGRFQSIGALGRVAVCIQDSGRNCSEWCRIYIQVSRERRAALSFRGVLREVETPVRNVSRIQELKKFKQVIRENALFVGMSSEHKASFKNSRTKLKAEHLKRLALVKQVQIMELACTVLRVEKDMLEKSTAETISNACPDPQWGLDFKKMSASVYEN